MPTKERTTAMPYINIQVTDEHVTNAQKEALIKGATDLMVNILGKDPQVTHVVIDEISTDNWGVGGQQVTKIRKAQSA